MPAQALRAAMAAWQAPGVISGFGTDLADGMVDRNMVQQFEQHRRITNATAADLFSPNFQRIRTDAQMHLAPLPWLRWAMLLGEPLPFALSLDPCANDQKVQYAGDGTIGDGDSQSLLTTS